MTDELNDMIMTSLRKIVRDHPYYGPAMTQLRLYEDDECPTASMSGNLELSYSRKFIEGLYKKYKPKHAGMIAAEKDEVVSKELCGNMLHELLHYIFDHHTRIMNNPRRDSINFVIHNIAADLEINQYIEYPHRSDTHVENYKMKDGSPFPTFRTYEEYLELLIANAQTCENCPHNPKNQQNQQQQQQQQQQQSQQQQQQSGSDNQQGNQSNQGMSAQGQGQNQQQGSGAGQQGCGGCGSQGNNQQQQGCNCGGGGSGQGQDQQQGSGSGSGSSQNQPGKNDMPCSHCVNLFTGTPDINMKGYRAGKTTASVKKLRAECEAAQEASGIGDSSSPINYVEKIVYDWSEVFKSVIHTKSAQMQYGFEHRTFSKPNRRLQGMDSEIIYPARIDYVTELNLVVGMDVSGSMQGLTEKMYRVMKSITDTDDLTVKITILECDTAVCRVIEDFNLCADEVESTDGCGTDMGAISVWIQEHHLDPDLIVIMTDNYTDWNPVLFEDKTVVLTNHKTAECPYRQFEVVFPEE